MIEFRLDPEVFSQVLEKACQRAIHDYRQFPGEETYHRAHGRLDGLSQGLGAVVKALGESRDAAALLTLIQEVVDRHARQLAIEAQDEMPG